MHSVGRWILRIAGFLFLCVFVLAGTTATYKFMNEHHSQKEIENLKASAVRTETLTAETSVPVSADLSFLQQKNPDTAAWLYVPSLSISYPVMYSGDNDYYLHRNFDREYAFAGSLFIDAECRPDFTSANTILYGHNMLSGEMFGTLWKIPYQQIPLDDPSIWIVTPENTLQYRIFSAFESDVYSDAFDVPESGTQEFLDWAVRMRQESFLQLDMDRFREKDRMVTLSTCGETNMERVFLIGRLEHTYPAGTGDAVTPQPDPKPDVPENEAGYMRMLKDKNFYLIGAGFFVITVLIVILCSRKRKAQKNTPDNR